ncbi:hypothetical protein [Shewanella baltica]|uniref:hypothetical protein n=1 Tax=Shewanella baltica TaxID=62322 RepID=UPI0002112E51|nr:hypothetical protein [Shewanella baltica]AEH16265.1 hypothetical protein Sbal117_4628 [Shewanella baltica OS117]
MSNNLIMKIGFLKPATTTVECGNHFRKIKNLIINDLAEEEEEEEEEEELKVSIHCNKWILTKMLEFEGHWDDDARQMHTLLHNQLILNAKSST